ncbi:hypothetical protein PROFUN_01871 [Planoprotostelium fungivorum]|uniref:Uncharacterized protein n=1 Tax=Planoprotostelium fungivorum TaxID=1890364 RepID=A0A2P6NYX1_9EUKA|nr:hypothetical protein PROFUN_01871 [Planoprotostelium fungivorum]
MEGSRFDSPAGLYSFDESRGEENTTIRWLPVGSPITVLTSPTAAYLTSSAWDRGSSSRKITKNTEKGEVLAKELPDRELNPGPKRSAYLTGLYTHHYTIEEW